MSLSEIFTRACDELIIYVKIKIAFTRAFVNAPGGGDEREG